MDAFISHASQDGALSGQLEAGLEAAGLSVWHDASEIAVGVLLSAQLRAAIRESRVLVLLWSAAAAASRWVATEWLTAVHFGRFVVPYVLDGTPLPQCFRNTVFLDQARDGGQAVERLTRAVREAPDGANPLAPIMRSQSAAQKQMIRQIYEAQSTVTTSLQRRATAQARDVQAALDGVIAQARADWPFDPMLVNLHGYHHKNAYMLTHWQAIQAGRPPDDAVLERAEGCFFETLALDPTDISALNGLGSVLAFRLDLEAAEFFITLALEGAKRQGIDYPAATADLQMVQYFRQGAGR